MRLRRPPSSEPYLGDSTPEKIVIGVVALRDWYEVRAVWHRRWFRLSGALIIICGSVIPFLAGIDFPAKNITIASLGVVITVAAALRSFYKWDHLWQVLRTTAFDLTVHIERWHLGMASLPGSLDDQARVDAINSLTDTLLTEANRLREQESRQYFGSLSFPPESAR